MDWLFGEPRLDDLLSDPVIAVAMARDGVDPASLRLLMRDVDRARTAGLSEAHASHGAARDCMTAGAG